MNLKIFNSFGRLCKPFECLILGVCVCFSWDIGSRLPPHPTHPLPPSESGGSRGSTTIFVTQSASCVHEPTCSIAPSLMVVPLFFFTLFSWDKSTKMPHPTPHPSLRKWFQSVHSVNSIIIILLCVKIFRKFYVRASIYFPLFFFIFLVHFGNFCIARSISFLKFFYTLSLSAKNVTYI